MRQFGKELVLLALACGAVISQETLIVDQPVTYPSLDSVSATSMTFGTTLNGTLSSNDATLNGGYVDYYSFDATAEQTIDIQLSSADFDAYLRLTDSAGNVVTEDDDSGGYPNARIKLTLKYGGTFIIHATTLYAESAGPYSLTLNIFSGIPAGTPVGTISVGGTVNGTLSKSDSPAVYRSGFEDFYYLTLTSQTDVTIQLSSPDGTMDSYLFLCDQTGSQILFENDDFYGLDSLVSGTLDAGTYLVAVSTYDGIGGNYALAVSQGLTDMSSTEIITIYEVYTFDTVFLAASTGEEQLRLTVDPNADWSTHGKYVSAVTKAANEFVKSGILDQQTAARLVKDAAKSGIGKSKLTDRITVHRVSERPSVPYLTPSGKTYYVNPKAATFRAR